MRIGQPGREADGLLRLAILIPCLRSFLLMNYVLSVAEVEALLPFGLHDDTLADTIDADERDGTNVVGDFAPDLPELYTLALRVADLLRAQRGSAP